MENKGAVATVGDRTYDSIQEALGKANSSDTVTVEEGPYKTNLEISKNLTLKARGQDVVEISSIT